MPERSVFFIYAIQVFLVGAAIAGLIYARWSLVFVGLAVFGLTLLPRYFARWVGVHLPNRFLLAIVFFIFATIFLGEVADFYGRYWWWDIALHFGSSVSFGLFGFLFIFMLFEGNRYAAPPWAIAFLSYCVAVAFGVLWEIFEFSMDQAFGLNMQKSGLTDTMGDLIVNMGGGAFAALAGFLYLKGRQLGGIGSLIEEFIRLNRKGFAKARALRKK